MKRLITLLALICSSSGAWAQPSVVVSVDAFDSRLSPYGAWLVLPGHGRVWQPSLEYVGDDFYPYGSGGHWVYTNVGWVFDSDLPFGWAVFHYGRWMLDPDYGWVWVPGNTWAPAWVSWRTGGAYIGWAPMGPAGAPTFHQRSWLFVETGQLTVVNVRSRAIDESRFHVAVSATQPMHGAVPVGPPPSYVAAATRVQISAVSVNEVHSAGRVLPPPPPPGRVMGPAAVRAQPGRALPPPAPGMDPERRAPPPPRLEPERRAPPPPRLEPERRAAPPPRQEPERQAPPPPLPARVEEPERLRGPGFAPPPQAPSDPGQPPPPNTKKKVQQPGPPGPPGPPRRGGR